ncbi:transcriptional repressor [Yersinia phage vB_YenM_324]|uniref:transcriptional repressor n=1 Tax=Yersinia phage vB_YenM_324 TaxID=2914024 RepID=UPI0023299621|nr:transcriptional repressor [Yersinia phage vB_YenM_324]UKL54190.1 repressor protein cI [Yersinia phage vB_YenM_324]
MAKFKLDIDTDGAAVLDRIIAAYGFSSKIMLAQHFDIAASSLSSRYKRGGFPADFAVMCMAETGVTLEWLATGEGKMFDDSQTDIFKIRKEKLIDGRVYEAGYLMFDKAFFPPNQAELKDPRVIIDNEIQYVVEYKFTDIFDGKWLVDIEGKTSIRELTRIPIRKVRVSGIGMAFDCELTDITVLGRVVNEIRSY